MSIAVDQSRLRRIVRTILGNATLDTNEVTTILELAQLAAGVEPEHDADEHTILQAVAQHVSTISGEKPGELMPIRRMPDGQARDAWLGALAHQLETPAARELAYALVFLVSVADLELTPAEASALEAFQHALGLDYRRATDLIVFLSEVVASGEDARGLSARGAAVARGS